MNQYALTPLKSKDTYIHHNIFKNCAGGIRFLAVKDGKNAKDLKGKEQGTQAGSNLSICQNGFIGKMSKESIRIQSYNDVKHQTVLIADNSFKDSSQSIHLQDIASLILFNNKDSDIKIKKVRVE